MVGGKAKERKKGGKRGMKRDDDRVDLHGRLASSSMVYFAWHPIIAFNFRFHNLASSDFWH